MKNIYFIFKMVTKKRACLDVFDSSNATQCVCFTTTMIMIIVECYYIYLWYDGIWLSFYTNLKNLGVFAEARHCRVKSSNNNNYKEKQKRNHCQSNPPTRTFIQQHLMLIINCMECKNKTKKKRNGKKSYKNIERQINIT